MGYYSNVNPDLLRFIPPDAKTVLEIGCGEGALCEAYRRVNPDVTWTGVESNEAALRIAVERGVIMGAEPPESSVEHWINDFDEHSEYDPAEPEFDCLILGDVLEHLVDPWEVMRGLSRQLLPGAQVLACIPNVQHWTVIRDLLEGKWDYQDSGLLDRTHLRFFTLKSIREMFDAAGLQIHEIVGRDLFNEGIESFCDNRFRCCNDFEPPKEWRAYQYIVRAFRPERWSDRYKGMEVAVTNPPYAAISPIDSAINRTPKLHIHAVTAEACCARPRILEPFTMLSTIPGVKCTTAQSFNQNVEPRVTADNRILIQQRFRTIPDMWVQATVAQDWVIVAEVDDLPEAIGMDPMALKAVHAIQCSTEALADVCRQYNPNVMVFPNQIAELPPLDRVKKLPHDDTVRVFFGAQNRQADWAPIMPALNRILADTPGLLVSVVHDREFYDALETGPNDSHKEFHPFCEYAEYRRLLGRCDIALLPLEDTPFNRCKSDFKFLECAAEGVVCIAANLSYCQIERLYFKDINYAIRRPLNSHPMMDGYAEEGGFEKALRYLIEHPQNRNEWAANAYAYVRDNRLLGQHFRQRHAWYQSLLAAKPTLDQSLADRVPELSGRLVTA